MTVYGAEQTEREKGSRAQRVACITDIDGAAGRAIARKLASEGVQLIMNSPTGKPVSATDLTYLQSLGVQVSVTAFPLTTGAQVAQLLQEGRKVFEQISILVHTHDEVQLVSVEACPEDAFEQVLEWNTKSAFLCTQAFGREMIEQGSGQIVYVSSIHDEKPTGSSFLYALSKGAIKMLCRESALALGRHGIRVNVIEMGPVAGDHERFASDLSDVYVQYETKVPSTKLGTCDDLADVVGYLISDQSAYLNGADIRVDGGFLLHYLDHKMKR